MEKRIATAHIIDAPGYVRDMETGAVVLKNKEHTDKYHAERQRKLAEIAKMTTLQNEVDSLRRDLDEIKETIRTLKR